MGPSARLLAAALFFLPALPAAEFTTYIGDVNDYHVARVAVDAAGNIYVAGSTSSPDFPLHNAFQSTPGPGFVVKLSADGSQLLYSTYFPDSINALAVDSAGAVYLAGTTWLTTFPVTPGLPAGFVSLYSIPIKVGAFLTKLSADGSHIVYSTVLSGSSVDCGAGSSCFTGE